MEITTDIILKGTMWVDTINKLNTIFNSRPNYQVYMLSLAIGIMYDRIIHRDEIEGEESTSVPRNVITSNDNGKMDFFFQAAILSTNTVDMPEKERLELAFGENNSFNKVTFLTNFANFGVTKLAELVGNSDVESMDNIKNFLEATLDGTNFDIYGFPDIE